MAASAALALANAMTTASKQELHVHDHTSALGMLRETPECRGSHEGSGHGIRRTRCGHARRASNSQVGRRFTLPDAGVFRCWARRGRAQATHWPGRCSGGGAGVGRYQIGELRHRPRRQIVTHALDDLQFCLRDHPCQLMRSGDRRPRLRAPWMSSVGVVSRANCSLRSGCAVIPGNCRRVPAGR